MASDSFILTGDVNVQITLTELDDGTIQFDVQVLDDTGSIGDLNALYFDLYDDSLTSSLTVTGDDVTGSAFKVDGVTKVDNYTNMNGEVVKDLGKFDGGIQFGTQGISEDDIQSTTFILSSDAGPLTLADFSLQDFGIRLTSVGEIDGAREDSLKLGGTAPELEGEEPEPPFLPCDDTITVSEDATFNFEADPVDAFEFNLLDNNAGVTGISAVNGDEAAVGTIVEGSNGGWIIINADGSFDVSAVNVDGFAPFDLLEDGQSVESEFTYTMDNGQVATLCVTFYGISDGDPGGPGGPGGEDPGGEFGSF